MSYCLATFCYLTIATACTPKSADLQHLSTTKLQVFQPKIDQSCNKSLPIVGIVDYIYFQDIEKLIQSSDLVVVGQPLTELGPDTTLRSIKAQENYPPFNLPINQSLVITDTFGVRRATGPLRLLKLNRLLKVNYLLKIFKFSNRGSSSLANQSPNIFESSIAKLTLP